ncbi:hypothetical protein [Acetobacter cerevisiae]|uniref:hypothetical protein n=1 Tax=Acetobacter cerevisiae TaxID=178900 RepID=UPI00209D5719|nr:hypothetical protein [Acetobacter cerevisiae]MCP1269315.1 hypothetical protein [Acetobacter cerevisiae]MCP1277269.1 hypothetical protein [Acetobacter cerevisiae]
MTASTTDKISSTLTAVADTVTAATTDKSGLSSALIHYLEHNNNAGQAIVRRHAEQHGLQSVISHWENHAVVEPTTEDVVQKLLPSEVIDRLAAESGLSRGAAITNLQEVLPPACRTDKVDAQRKARQA